MVGEEGDRAADIKLYKQRVNAKQAALGNTKSKFSQTSTTALPEVTYGFSSGDLKFINPDLAGLPEINKNAMSKELLGEVLQMNPYQFKQWQKGLSPQDYQRYIGNAKYAESYNAFAQN